MIIIVVVFFFRKDGIYKGRTAYEYYTGEREREQAGTRETFFSKCPPPDSFNRMEELVLSFFDTDYRRPAEKFS